MGSGAAKAVAYRLIYNEMLNLVYERSYYSNPVAMETAYAHWVLL